MKPIITILILTFLNLNNIPEMHPVHISVTNIDYIQADKSYKISIKLFADDFEKIINKNYNVKLNLGKENENKDCNKLIVKYIQGNFSFAINSKNIFKNTELTEKKVKPEDNTVFLYFKTKHISGKKVKIKNTLMTDLYDDQKNLFIFTFKNTQEAYKFEKNNTNFEFSIE